MQIDIFSSDAEFDSIYSLRARQLSSIHWTPLDIAKKAAEHLTNGNGKNILDIGSGVGKFCIVGAHYYKENMFHGIEQRKALHDEALIAQKTTDSQNTNFIYGNFTELDMDLYDHFYFYNSFSENIYHYKPIDNLVNASAELYYSYLDHFYSVLDDKPAGTRLATFHCQDHQIPPSYKRVKHITGEQLKLWVKL